MTNPATAPEMESPAGTPPVTGKDHAPGRAAGSDFDAETAAERDQQAEEVPSTEWK